MANDKCLDPGVGQNLITTFVTSASSFSRLWGKEWSGM